LQAPAHPSQESIISRYPSGDLQIFKYNVKLAVMSMRRNPIMTGLMVAAIAVGIGVSMTTLTVAASVPPAVATRSV